MSGTGGISEKSLAVEWKSLSPAGCRSCVVWPELSKWLHVSNISFPISQMGIAMLHSQVPDEDEMR